MAEPPVVAAYGLRRPDLDEVRAAVRRVTPHTADEVWAGLLRAAGLDGAHPRGDDAVERVVTAMKASDDPVVVLCARAVTIRLSSYEHLAATAEIVRNPR
jgi:hypothetical protein